MDAGGLRSPPAQPTCTAACSSVNSNRQQGPSRNIGISIMVELFNVSCSILIVSRFVSAVVTKSSDGKVYDMLWQRE